MRSMAEPRGDLRRAESPTIESAQESLRTLGYVVMSDANPVTPSLGPTLRTEILPAMAENLQEDPYKVPPLGRKRVTAMAGYARQADGTVDIVSDYREVAIPSRSFFNKPRVYRNGYKVLGQPIFVSWLKGALSIIPAERQQEEGALRVDMYETYGDVVTTIHRDDEEFVGSFPEYINGTGAATSLYRKADPGTGGPGAPDFEKLVTIKVNEGDGIVSDDVNLWHYVDPVEASAEGSKACRRSLIIVYYSAKTYAWLRDYYASSRSG
jgi:hypothetical protein